MYVLVTGAAGNLGSATCEQLKAAGIEFRATDVRTRKDIGYKVVVENLLNREACYQLMDGCDALVHIANRPNEHAGSAQAVFGENCTMNINIFQAAHELGVRKIIYASSIQTMLGSRRVSQAETVPSNHPYLPADSDTPAKVGNHYAASKVAGEQLLRYFAEHRGLESAVSLRLPGMVRPDWFEWMHKHANVDRMWRDEYADEIGAWLSFADAGRLVVAILRSALPGYRSYFPAFPSLRYNITEKDYIERFFKTVPLKKPIEEMHGLVDISRITAETGWKPADDFRAVPPKTEEAKKS